MLLSYVHERLRDGVEDALRTFGSDFLAHPANQALRDRVTSGRLLPAAYYHQLLRLVYRLLFLMLAEERNLVGPESTVYRQLYNVARLRDLVEGYEAGVPVDGSHTHVWRDLVRAFHLFADESLPGQLVDLFGPDALRDLESAELRDVDLIHALACLLAYRVRRVNDAALDVEELGHVYEGLLEHHPVIDQKDSRLTFGFVPGKDRKTTGSYYTHPELVRELVVSALDPVIADRVKDAATPATREKSLLSIRVCDPAAGSGHFLLAAARRLGDELARVRTGVEHPGPDAVRLAVRDAITHCIYGVDKNPLAVDLCKVALWLEGYNEGLPLTFLDHRIRCGDSLVGVLDLRVLDEGIPAGAYAPVSHDDRKTAAALNRRNKAELGTQAALDRLRVEDSAWRDLRTACNLWTAAFFTPLANGMDDRPATTDTIRRCLAHPSEVDARLAGEANRLAERAGFFHWPLEFPEVFASSSHSPGFDVLLGNPPWERIKLQEQEFFTARDPTFARDAHKAARAKFIATLPEINPALWQSFERARHSAEALSKFLRASGRFPLTACGDINTYSVFAELFGALLNQCGRAGILIPTGIATDSSNKRFFTTLVDSGRLAALYDFENRKKLFGAVDSRYKFCLLTLRGAADSEHAAAEFVFFATRPDHLRDEHSDIRRFALTPADFARINPNTRTCPVFRTRRDADLARRIYEHVPVLVNEATGENPWGIRFAAMFHMSNDSGLFRTRADLADAGGRLIGNRFQCNGEAWLPLYEAKMMWHFDHRFGGYSGGANGSSTHWPTPTPAQYADPHFSALPRYWVPTAEVGTRLGDWTRQWLLAYRALTNATNERTFVAGLLPVFGCGNSTIVCTIPRFGAGLIACLVANFSSLVFDWVTRQKLGGTNMNVFYVKQLPVLPPTAYAKRDLAFIVPRVLELTCTAWDLQAFADDVWREATTDLRAAIAAQAATIGVRVAGSQVRTDLFPYPPFRWDDDRRATLRAELDAFYARLYGLTEEELRYVLDPADVCGADYPGETFRVLRRKEVRRFGEYRTRRLVLDAWQRLAETVRRFGS